MLAQRDAVTCSLGGLSKSVGFPQLKLGWIAFSGPSTALAGVLGAYEIVADAYRTVAPKRLAAALDDGGPGRPGGPGP